MSVVWKNSFKLTQIFFLRSSQVTKVGCMHMTLKHSGNHPSRRTHFQLDQNKPVSSCGLTTVWRNNNFICKTKNNIKSSFICFFNTVRLSTMIINLQNVYKATYCFHHAAVLAKKTWQLFLINCIHLNWFCVIFSFSSGWKLNLRG